MVEQRRREARRRHRAPNQIVRHLMQSEQLEVIDQNVRAVVFLGRPLKPRPYRAGQRKITVALLSSFILSRNTKYALLPVLGQTSCH
jgi:hypothetical protein